MTRDEFISKVSGIVKLIRVESDFTQDKMAHILGISKKTLVQVEKGRSQLGWTATVAVCLLFRDSEVLQSAVGGEPLEIIDLLAFNEVNHAPWPTLGGRVWWIEFNKLGDMRIQQNIITKHYRLLDHQDRRWCSSFDLDYVQKRLKELTQNKK